MQGTVLSRPHPQARRDRRSGWGEAEGGIRGQGRPRACWKIPSCGLASPPLSAPHVAAVLSDPGRRALRKQPCVRSSGGKSHSQDGRGLEGRGPQPLSQGLKIHTYLLKVKEFSATQTREVGPFLSWKPSSRSGGAQRHYLQHKGLNSRIIRRPSAPET